MTKSHQVIYNRLIQRQQIIEQGMRQNCAEQAQLMEDLRLLQMKRKRLNQKWDEVSDALDKLEG